MKTIKIKGREEFQAETLYDLTDTQRQELAEQMLKHFTVHLMNAEVEYILSKSYGDPDAPFSHDDMVNAEPTCSIEISGQWYELTESERLEKLEHYQYLYDKAQDTITRAGEKLAELEGEAEHEYDDRISRLDKRADRLDDIVFKLQSLECDDYPEVMQWFLAPELCYHLKERGQVVLNGEYWGRQTCGQAICLDHVIQQLAFELNW